MKRRLQNLTLALISLCFLLSSVVFSPATFAFKPDKDTDPAVLRKCIEQIDDHLKSSGPSAKAYGSKAQILEWLHEPREAIGQYSQALRISPKNTGYLLGRARSYRLAKDWGSALADYDAAIAFGRRDSEAYVGRALTLLSLSKFDRALQDADKAVGIDSTDSAGWFAKGNAEFELGRLKQSVSSISKAIQLKPGEPAFFELRRQVYIRLGEKSKASSDLASLQQFSRKIK